MTATPPPAQGYFAAILARGWKHLMWRGIAAIAFGVLTWFRPDISLAALVTLFGLYALFDGILASWIAVKSRELSEQWWLVLLVGLIGIALGVMALVSPGPVAVAFLFIIAAWAISRGILEIVAAIRLRKDIRGEWMLGLAGAVSVAFGVLLLSRPGAGILTLLWVLATYAVIFGILLVLLAFKVRNFGDRVEAT
jgi:uncharacterized membrane protein HdeD (DUF308 family)